MSVPLCSAAEAPFSVYMPVAGMQSCGRWKNRPWDGSSCRNAGHIMSWNDDKYSAIEDEMGENTASRVAQSQAAAIDFIEQACCTVATVGLLASTV